MKRLLPALLIPLALLFAIPDQAAAKDCGDVKLNNGRVWWVGGSGMPCKKMRRWAKSMLKGNGRPKGWSCGKRGRGYKRSGSCARGWNPQFQQPRWFWAYYPPH